MRRTVSGPMLTYMGRIAHFRASLEEALLRAMRRALASQLDRRLALASAAAAEGRTKWPRESAAADHRRQALAFGRRRIGAASALRLTAWSMTSRTAHAPIREGED